MRGIDVHDPVAFQVNLHEAVSLEAGTVTNLVVPSVVLIGEQSRWRCRCRRMSSPAQQLVLGHRGGGLREVGDGAGLRSDTAP
jgi:hypothetical protein